MTEQGNGYRRFTNLKGNEEAKQKWKTVCRPLEEDKSFVLKLWRDKSVSPAEEIKILEDLYCVDKEQIIKFLYAYGITDSYIVNYVARH